MNNVAYVEFGRAPAPASQETRVADVDNGYTRIANELLEEAPKNRYGLTKREYQVLLVVVRRTYGFNKKLDWLSGEQLAEATELTENHAREAIRSLVAKRILVKEGRRIGPNKVISEWQTKQPQNGVNNPKTGLKNNPKTGSRITPKQGHTKDNIKDKKEKDLENTSAEPATAASTQVVVIDEQPSLIGLPLNTGEDHPVTEHFAAQMQQLYPAVDVMQELRAMRGWLLANPTRRKTRKGIPRFINNWLARCQDRGGSSGMTGSQPSGPLGNVRAAQAAAARYAALLDDDMEV